jgi:hypothetical protein
VAQSSPGAIAATSVAGIRDDSIATSLQLLSTPEIHHLLSTIDTQRFSHEAVAVPAVTGHDMPHALASLSEFVTRHPEHANELLTSPALAPIRSEVTQLLHHITEVARTEAVRSVSNATAVVDAAKHSQQIAPQMDGPAALAVAERLIESGQLANYYRAADLGLVVIGAYSPRDRTPEKKVRVAVVHRRVAAMIRALWRRAPLLVLLLGWLAVGVAGALIAMLKVFSASSVQAGFELWGVGVLGLVVFQFYVTTRNN